MLNFIAARRPRSHALLLALMASSLASSAAAAPLTLIIEGLRSDAGDVRIAILPVERGKRRAGPVGVRTIKAAKGVISTTFTSLEPGDYAIELYHDEDGNGKMKMRMGFIPAEGVGFSNRAQASFGRPSLKAMQFRLADAPVETVAVMKYF